MILKRRQPGEGSPATTFMPCSIIGCFDKLSILLLSFFMARHPFVSY